MTATNRDNLITMGRGNERISIAFMVISDKTNYSFTANKVQ